MAGKIIRQADREHQAVTVFKHHSAMARVRELVDGVFEVAYSGVLTEKTYQSLRSDVLRATRDAAALVLRMDAGLIAMPEITVIPRGTYARDAAPGAVVVREDQFDYWSAYSRSAAQSGIMRAVFLDYQLERARDWACRHALLWRSGLLR